eukprot:18047-Heterococcus_DN1.PRE.1
MQQGIAEFIGIAYCVLCDVRVVSNFTSASMSILHAITFCRNNGHTTPLAQLRATRSQQHTAETTKDVVLQIVEQLLQVNALQVVELTLYLLPTGHGLRHSSAS